MKPNIGLFNYVIYKGEGHLGDFETVRQKELD